MTEAADLPLNGRLIAIDWGERRIGVAISDEMQTVARPLATLTRRDGKRFPMQQLRAHLDEQHPVGVVVGLPLDEVRDLLRRAFPQVTAAPAVS